jgi:hypothetical protein
MCVPNAILEQQAMPFSLCIVKSLAAEGRCLPDCLPTVASQLDRLTTESCNNHQHCVPCYDPVTGESTGACEQPGDPGPTQPPVTFEHCCEGAGRCIPNALISPADREGLARDSCEDASQMCVPAGLAEERAFAPARCVTSAFEAEGRCLPACLPAVASQANRLKQDGCDGGELCTPCFDPFTGASTHACTLGADRGPRTMPKTFESCCFGIGRCVPDRLLSKDERAQLGPDTCDDPDTACVPAELATSDGPGFRKCTVSSLRAAGRCVPECLPGAEKYADKFERDACPAHYLCLPCVDPLSGKSTELCDGSSEPEAPVRTSQQQRSNSSEPESGSEPAPDSAAPVVFESCYHDLGKCVPNELLPADQVSRLERESCAGDAESCVPADWVTSDEFVPERCEAQRLHAEGRCLLSYLPQVAARASMLEPDGCSDWNVCVPCYDPISGESTGACELGADPGPSQPAQTFAECCGGLGQCVPAEYVPAELSSTFDAGDCAAERELLCVAPAQALTTPDDFKPAECHDATSGAEGRCLPACLPAVAGQAANLHASGCGAGFLCVPCYEPFEGRPTGACSIGADPGPSEPPHVLEGCCVTGGKSLGVCLTPDLLPGMVSDQLVRGSCSAANALCVPRAIANRDGTSVEPFAACGSGSSPGACLPSCFIDSLAASVLSQSTCTSSERCAPCVRNGAATGVCAGLE